MREASVILPSVDHLATQQFRRDLVTYFGGWSATMIIGEWLDPTGRVKEDISTRYVVAADWTPTKLDTLRNLARWAGQKAHQQCVYLQGPDGEVEFIQCHPVEAVLPLGQAA